MRAPDGSGREHRAGGGGSHKTTAPITSDHRVPAALAATAGRHEKWNLLGDDTGIVSVFGAMQNLTGRYTFILHSTEAFGRHWLLSPWVWTRILLTSLFVLRSMMSV